MSSLTACRNIFVIFFIVFIDSLQAACPPGWVMWQDSCYILLPEKMDWFEASKVCNRPGSGLAMPESLKEQEFIWQEMNKFRGEIDTNFELWIACQKDGNTGQLACPGKEDGSYYTNWDDKQYQGTEEDCIRMRPDQEGKWADLFCTSAIFAACEMPHDSHPVYCLRADANGRFTPKCLLNHEIKNLTAEGVNGCGQACWAEPRCHSFNLWQQGKICQLNDATRLDANVSDFQYVEDCYSFDL